MIKLSRFQILFLPCFLSGGTSETSLSSGISDKVSEEGLQVPTAEIPKLNLFNGYTLAAVTKEAIKFFLNPENASEQNASEHFKNIPFIFKNYFLPKAIQNNSELKSRLQKIMKHLGTFSLETLTEGDYLSKLYKMRSHLKKAHDLVANDTDITVDSAFARFIQGNIKAINVIIADAVAKKVFQKIRSQLEAELLKTSTATSVSVESSVGWGPFSLSISGDLDTKQDSGANSLYEISRSGNLSIGIGAETPGDILSISCQAGATLTFTTLFHSIEQLLDSGQLKGTISEETSQKLSTRRALQNAEKQLLSVMGSDVEGFLKMVGIIPLSTYVEWPHPTKAEAPMTSLALGGEWSVSTEAKSFTKLGMEISGSYSGTIYKKPRLFLSLLDNDGHPADNLTAEDIKRIVGKQYDFSRKLLKIPENSHLESFNNSDINVLVPIYILCGDLRGYISVIQELAALEQFKASNLEELDSLKLDSLKNQENIKKLKEDVRKLEQSIEKLTPKKHNYESRLSPQHTFTSEGRLGVLKTYIVTAAMLSQYAKTTEEIALFKKMFLELKKLELLLEFSKDKSSQSGTFIQNANYSLRTKEISGTIKVSKGFISCDYNEYSNSPFLDENGRYLSFSITIPFSTIGSATIQAIQAIKDYLSKKTLTDQEIDNRIVSGVKHIATDLLNWTKTLEPFGIEIDLSNASPLKIGPSISGFTKVNAQSMWIEPNSDQQSSLKPLPGKELMVRDSSQLVVQCYKASLSTKTEIKGEIKGIPTPAAGVTVGGSVSASKTTTGQTIVRLGTNTISYVLSKFNIWQMGANESEGKTSTAWEALKKNNQDAFSEIFKNIAKDESGPFYELQCLYNDILKNVGADTDLGKKCTKLFGKLLEDCAKLSTEEPKEVDLQAALASFDEVLTFNYHHSFLLHLNEAFSLHKTSKH
ncbi:MAG: hypothetical protein LBD60_02695 [Puniceicoccales bacterium]|nr:hypothetical protein [Puniceicoccales bacterium]